MPTYQPWVIILKQLFVVRCINIFIQLFLEMYENNWSPDWIFNRFYILCMHFKIYLWNINLCIYYHLFKTGHGNNRTKIMLSHIKPRTINLFELFNQVAVFLGSAVLASLTLYWCRYYRSVQSHRALGKMFAYMRSLGKGISSQKTRNAERWCFKYHRCNYLFRPY